MSRIYVLGSINMDVVVTAPRHPQRGETIFGETLHFIPGGKGANQAIAARRLGQQVALIGRLGRDQFGESLHTFLTQEGLDLSHLALLDDAPTGTALITVSHDSENTIVVVSGANARLTAEDVAAVDLAAGDIVVSQFEVPQPAIAALFARARAVGAYTILNPAPAGPFIEDLLSLVCLLIVNETELAFLTQTPLTDDLAQMARAAGSLGLASDQTLIVTLGSRGALRLQAGVSQYFEGQQVQAVDTTGAGDCFVGAMAAALAGATPPEKAVLFANRAAALSVQRFGAAVAMPTLNEMGDHITDL